MYDNAFFINQCLDISSIVSIPNKDGDRVYKFRRDKQGRVYCTICNNQGLILNKVGILWPKHINILALDLDNSIIS